MGRACPGDVTHNAGSVKPYQAIIVHKKEWCFSKWQVVSNGRLGTTTEMNGESVSSAIGSHARLANSRYLKSPLFPTPFPPSPSLASPCRCCARRCTRYVGRPFHPPRPWHQLTTPCTRSDDAPGIENAQSASTATFVTALVFNAIVFAAELVVFTILRPYFPAIYQPRTYIVPQE